jgi:hypothetical protein
MVMPRASHGTTDVASNNRVVRASAQITPARRPEVEKAMRSLREMPPYAREREIDHGHYSNFSSEEMELLRAVSR